MGAGKGGAACTRIIVDRLRVSGSRSGESDLWVDFAGTGEDDGEGEGCVEGEEEEEGEGGEAEMHVG